MYDLVIKGGSIVDGTGAAPFTGDLAVEDGLIAEVGRVQGRARRTLDAGGTVVTPGWIDAHTHYDGQVTWDAELEGSIAHGVTTVVMGNCGVGFAPVRPEQYLELIDLMEGVEDIPGTALYEGMPWGAWESFPEYLDFLATRSWTVDVGAQLAHGALRHYVMGERSVDGTATATDLEQMSALVEEAARAGAIAFSTSRVQVHKSLSGEYVPGTFAAEDELAALARAVVRGGGFVVQAIPASATGRSTHPKLAPLHDEVAMLGRISRASGVRVVFSAFQTNDDPDGWREVLAGVGHENGAGAALVPMVAPRGITTLTTLQGYHPFMLRPTYSALAELPHPELVAALRRPEVKAAILAEDDVREGPRGAMRNVLPRSFARSLRLMYPMCAPIDYEPTPDQSMAARAEAQGRDRLEFLYDFLLEDGGTSVAMLLGANYIEGNLEACREMLLDPYTVSGLSDAGAHVGVICDMSAPTFHLTHWARDRTRGERLPIEHVVHKATGRIAAVLGLKDRGTISVGKRADLNVVDHDALRIEQPVLRRDLPAGGSRFVQGAIGYVATFNHGVQTRDQGVDTGERPGRLVRAGR